MPVSVPRPTQARAVATRQRIVDATLACLVEHGYAGASTARIANEAEVSEGAVFKMKFKYVGVRDRGGRQEAVVEIGGSLAGSANAKGIEGTDAKEEPPQAADDA